ncbi:MAG: delta(24(24(1)))-sterol reductase [Chloroflexota bacterium]|nr:delta(24(24(1)))-sterol reductase [Chloroflexota bacterium]
MSSETKTVLNDVSTGTVSRTTAREFGGAPGVVAIVTLSHALLLYLWIAWRFYDGALFFPSGLGDVGPYLGRIWEQISTHAAPSWSTFAIYWAFLAAQGLLAAYLPGLRVKGYPIPSRGGRRLTYRINAISAWWLTLALVAVLHFSDVFPLQTIYERFGSFMVAAMITGNAVALAVFFGAKLTGNAERMTGNHIYDFFMGAWLNPRIGRLDLKMWAEVRVSWLTLFLLTASAAAYQFSEHGTLSTPMIFMLVAHFLYANACMKGEECIPTTWDIFHEKWGWMLAFWNLAGVPFVYCFNSMYVAARPDFEPPVAITVACFVMLFGAYYVWDTSQGQRNYFRMQLNGSYVKRRAFPQLPWAKLENPRYLETACGSPLLVDGWWRYARKIHYTADVIMALSWGLICGFGHFLPYFYVTFFVLMILHRARRDTLRCRKKYGSDWDRYTKTVPHLFIPKVW